MKMNHGFVRRAATGLMALALVVFGPVGCGSDSKSPTGTDPDPDPVYDTTWVYSRVVTLAALDTASTDTLENYPLLVRLSNAHDSTGADVLTGAQPGGTDIRFFTGDGETALSHEIEHWSSTHAAIWVLLPSVAGSAETSVLLHWGDSPGALPDGAVFDTANGFEAVFHLAEAGGDTIRDATVNGYLGVPIGTMEPENFSPVSGGLIGNAKDFGGDPADITQGGGYRLVTAEGGNTFDSFDYAGNDAVFTLSAWVRVNAMPSTNALRRGILTKADSGNGTANTNLQWHMRTINDNNGSFSVLRTSVAPVPFSVSRPDAVDTWTYVTYSSDAATNSLRVYNDSGPVGAATPANQNGAHQDVNVFIGAFSGAAGEGTQFFNGFIDEVRISSVARSDAWHDLDFATQRPGATAVRLGETEAEEHITEQ